MSDHPKPCHFVAHNQPRMLRSHVKDCEASGCEGCQPCREPHCRVCWTTHHEQTCAECVGITRATLHEIADRCGALPTEIKYRGVNGEAMVLAGPASDPEAWGHVEASIMCGRLPAEWQERLIGDHHPSVVLGGWEMVWRDHLEHETDKPATLPSVVAYLDMQLHYMSSQPLIPFEDFAKDLYTCANHLRAVLHDQNHGDKAGVGCFECGSGLERLLTKTGLDDVWTCSRCRRKYTSSEYNFALRAALEANAQVAPA
jgi:hypothetical protein